MADIYVNFSGLEQIGTNCKEISSKIDAIQSDFESMVRNLDWDVRFQSGINRTATQISQELDRYSGVLMSYQKFIDYACQEYQKLDQYTTDIDPKQNGFEHHFAIKPEKEPNKFSKIKPFFEVANFCDYGKESGIAKGVVSYLEDLHNFIYGDKKGLTGASNFCNLADSSISVWKEAYDYFSDQYKNLKTGFFGESVRKNIAILSLSGSGMRLIGSLLSDSKGLDQKKWQNIVADYIDNGNDIFSIVKSGYELKHLQDVKSLVTKEGGWSPLDVYGAIADSVSRSISQGFKSYGKYSSDGIWNWMDTGTTGVDVTTAGLYGISKLSFGLGDIIFESVSVKDSDLSYAEQAAEGYKILANYIGDRLGHKLVECREWIRHIIR